MAEIKQTSLPGVLEIFPRVFPDSRGYFFESFRQDWLEKMGVHESWVQDNQSFSQKGTVRGIHFQQGEHAQAKLVRVIAGKVLDVAVDLRKRSSTFGHSKSMPIPFYKVNEVQEQQSIFPRYFELQYDFQKHFLWPCETFDQNIRLDARQGLPALPLHRQHTRPCPPHARH